MTNRLPDPILLNRKSKIENPLLVLDGDLPSASLIDELRAHHGGLVAADGAALKLRALGIASDLVIGDLDSIGEMRESFAAEGVRIIEDSDQERNDFEKALEWIIAQGATSATVLGMSGGMADHALNNFSVLAKFARRIALSIRDDRFVAYALHGSIKLDVTPGDRISLIPLPSARLTTHGLLWELHGELLALGVREGASNRATGAEVRVDVVEGLVLVFRYL